MNGSSKGPTLIVHFLILSVAYLLCNLEIIHGKTRISTFYHRFIRNAGTATDEKNFIEAIHDASAPIYNHYYLSATELSGSDPSCGKLCPKGIHYPNSKRVEPNLILISIPN